MRRLFEIDLKDYEGCSKVFRRPSVRGIIFKGNKIAMVYATNEKYCKFPGGGMHDDEDKKEALLREVKEEVGLDVIPESIREYGSVLRRQRSDRDPDTIFEQENFYFLCRTGEMAGKQNLDAYEAEAGFQLSYMDIDDAIRINIEYRSECFFNEVMIDRERRVLELIKASRYDVVALGELLIDFTESGKSADGMKLFEQNPGGAPANLLTALSHSGYKTAFIGKVGDDMHGRFLIETLEKEGIETGSVIKDPEQFTTLAFVGLDQDGERTFSFARKPGADTMLRSDELNREMLSMCKIFHFGSLSLTDEPARSATLEAVQIAKSSGAVISYDPNYRASLWPDEKTAADMMRSAVPLADVLKVSGEESLLLTGCSEIEDAADCLLSMGPKFVAVTLGSDGVLIARKDRKDRIGAFQVKSIDTTGAGDSFWGGFLSCWLSYGVGIDEMNWEDLQNCARTGSAFAALCVQKRGGIPSVPSKEEVEQFLKNR
ncbi:MAG: NUDIX domain-containing protein [Clostridiales bacterium]|nr:NUDIX domain-containing protein [Clostridiales bacterium]